MRFSAGVTLIELLVVMAVSAVLMGVAAPNLRDWITKRAAASAADALIADFRFARSEAIKRSDFVTICRSTDGSTCAPASASWQSGWIVFVTRRLPGPDATDAIILRVQGALPWVTSMTATQFPGATFGPNGTVSGAAGRLVVDSTVPGARVALCLSMNGRLQARPGQSAC